jgi:lipopolysaccharide transport system ATP-binding protein
LGVRNRYVRSFPQTSGVLVVIMPELIVKNVSLGFPVFGKAADALAIQNNDGANTGSALMRRSGERSFQILALENVSFSLKAGDNLGIVGRNGSGKSTLLRVLAGIYPPSQGVVTSVGVIAPLFSVGLGTRPEATGRRNIVLRGLLRGLNRSQIEHKMPEIIEFSELGSYIDMPVRTYSAGMAMRLSFSIATCLSPDILLLDEWIGAGDMEFREKASARLHELVQAAGITVVASHNRGLLRQVCTQAMWLDRGLVRALGPIDEVYEKVDAAGAQ